jgi:paraquat-inducible protein B
LPMSQKANPTSIGLFIVIGLALGVTGLLLFSSSRIFTPSHEIILYFNDSLNGLNEGAPVKYRGVTIGSVKRVMIHFNQATNDYAMPVIVEIQKNLLKERMGEESAAFTDTLFTDRVQHGMRGFLESESMVTGVLYIEVRILDDAVPPVYHQVEKLYLELPTQPTQIQKLLSNLASLDFKRIETNLNALITRIDSAVGGLKMGEINDSLTNLLGSLNRVVNSPDITNSLAGLKGTLAEYRLLAENLNRQVDPLANGVTNTLAEANQALAQIRGGVENLRDLLAPDSALRQDLTLALEQLGGAAQSISSLTDFLQHHPNALLTGRRVPETKP